MQKLIDHQGLLGQSFTATPHVCGGRTYHCHRNRSDSGRSELRRKLHEASKAGQRPECRGDYGSLEARSIPSRMGEDGWITVPAHLDEARLIASMTHGKVDGGLEMFDQPTFGASQFDKYVNYIRGLEGELGRTIARIDGVKSARVHLTIPKRRPIRSLQKPPKASVNLRLAENMMLPRGRVRSIQLMAASAVEGMNPDKVSVTDQHGNNLSAPEDASKGDDRALKLKNKYEESVSERVLNMLEPVVGVGKVRVNVTASMDFANVQETRTDIDPDKQTVKSESTSEETSTSDQTGAAGVVGQAANDPQRAQGGAGGGKTNSLKKSEQRVFENAMTVTKRAEGGARVKQLSVGVIIDGYMGEDADGKQVWTAWTADEMKNSLTLYGAVRASSMRAAIS